MTPPFEGNAFMQQNSEQYSLESMLTDEFFGLPETDVGEVPNSGFYTFAENPAAEIVTEEPFSLDVEDTAAYLNLYQQIIMGSHKSVRGFQETFKGTAVEEFTQNMQHSWTWESRVETLNQLVDEIESIDLSRSQNKETVRNYNLLVNGMQKLQKKAIDKVENALYLITKKQKVQGGLSDLQNRLFDLDSNELPFYETIKFRKAVEHQVSEWGKFAQNTKDPETYVYGRLHHATAELDQATGQGAAIVSIYSAEAKKLILDIDLKRKRPHHLFISRNKQTMTYSPVSNGDLFFPEFDSEYCMGQDDDEIVLFDNLISDLDFDPQYCVGQDNDSFMGNSGSYSILSQQEDSNSLKFRPVIYAEGSVPPQNVIPLPVAEPKTSQYREEAQITPHRVSRKSSLARAAIALTLSLPFLTSFSSLPEDQYELPAREELGDSFLLGDLVPGVGEGLFYEDPTVARESYSSLSAQE